MTMRIVILRPDEAAGLMPGEEHFIDRIDALKMIEEGKATLPDLYKKIVKKTAETVAAEKLEAEKKAAEKAIAEKKAEEARKAELLKKQKEENASSKKAKGRSRAVKK